MKNTCDMCVWYRRPDGAPEYTGPDDQRTVCNGGRGYCHRNAPSREGFPIVLPYDYCREHELLRSEGESEQSLLSELLSATGLAALTQDHRTWEYWTVTYGGHFCQRIGFPDVVHVIAARMLEEPVRQRVREILG